MADEFGEKTEAPTPRRRQEAREEGNIPRSTDLTAALMLLGAVLLLGMFGRRMFGAMESMVASMLNPGDPMVKVGDLGPLISSGLHFAAQMLAPIALGVMVLGVVANMVQVGFSLTGKPLVPKFSKISPVRGLKQIFSLRGLVRLGMSMAKVAAVSAIAIMLIIDDFPLVLALIHLESLPLLAAAGGLVYALAIKIALLLLVLAIIDYSYQKWQHEQDLRMSKQEIKEEYKKMEGDPLVKQRRARVARQLAMQRMAYDVPKADVIVTNPTHFAVALKYDSTNMAAPKVIAKGADFMAMRIRQIAAANEIPIVERPPLARTLYRHVAVGQEIPAQHYAAVAEILAYVYRLSGRKIA
jgi:flagellar biosynthetic protein FlhB